MHEKTTKLATKVVQSAILASVLIMSNAAAASKPAIVIHGGAGTIT